MKWFFPSWNGDFRLEADGDDASRLEIVSATEGEKTSIGQFLTIALQHSWVTDEQVAEVNYDSATYRESSRLTIPLKASIGDAGKALVKLLKPKDRTITGVKFENGALEIIDSASVPPKKKDGFLAKAAASVARATPSCPQCVPGAVDRASEVLLTFLNEEEHEDWATQRAIVVRGGISEHRYLLAHRHSKMAAKIGRICFDLDDQCVIHFHDNTVPPEEEILGAKLILEHREPWLRNEATHFGYTEVKFKNPFGDIRDGVWDASFTQAVGTQIAALNALTAIGNPTVK